VRNGGHLGERILAAIKQHGGIREALAMCRLEDLAARIAE
jgi:hypothetical protein